MSILNEIFEWSTGRPTWQRDALRRLVVSGDLSDEDIAELALVLKSARGIELKVDAPAPRFLARTDLALPGANEQAVVLDSIRDLQNVNALAEGQTLTFAPEGLTVVYGDNGAGKSGYVRVLKQVCRARVQGNEIKRNAFGDTGQPPSGTIVYHVGPTLHEDLWHEGAAAPRELGSISVFDSACAAFYVENKTDVAYRPFGLDLLAKLAAACDRVKKVLSADIEALEDQKQLLTGFPNDGAVGKFLRDLKPTTTKQQIDELGHLTKAEQTRLNALRVQIAQIDARGHGKQAAELRGKASRFKALGSELTTIEAGLTVEVEASLQAALKLLVEAEAASKLASALSFNNEPLPAVGSVAWRRLWDAAKEYSTAEAYKDQAFPNLGEDARCVLCQQPLREEGLARFRTFDQFVQDRSQIEAAAAATRVVELKQLLEKAPVAVVSPAVLEEIGTTGTDLRDAVTTFLSAAAERKASLQRALAQNDWTGVPALGANPAPLVNALAEEAEKQAVATEAAANPTERAKLQQELSTLDERDRFRQMRPQVLRETERLAQLEKVRVCLTDTETNTITRRSTELTKAAVSDTLCATFEKELKALGLSHLAVVLDPTGGAKGTLYHSVQIRRQDGKSVPGVEHILSEGEQRCIALAAFLAELSTQQTLSGIVLDDPVSSLDHERRETIAKRLVEEAKTRPVLVFTHDLVFLLALDGLADNAGTAFTGRHLQRSAVSVGQVVGDLPWYGLSVRKRIGYLRDELQRLKRSHKEGQVEIYQAGIERLYSLLRKSWEKAIEEVLLDGAIQRFGHEVQTQRLKKVLDYSKADYEVFEAGMKKCSSYMHDVAPAVNRALPDPTEVLADIGELESWVEAIRKRR